MRKNTIDKVTWSDTASFDIEKIASSGQCFRLNRHPTKENVWELVAYGRYLKIEKAPDNEGLDFFCTQQEFNEIWQEYFDLKTDYKHYIDKIDKNDTYLTAAAQAGRGTKILRQELWEVMVSFIISQNNNIPRIKRSIEALCCASGKAHPLEEGRMWHQFPEPPELTRMENLEPAALGYRAGYVQNLAEKITAGEINLSYLMNDEINDEEIRSYLEGIYGIGPKVANCIMLFGLHRIDSFPRDKWINTIIQEKYNGNFPIEKYKGFAGIIQQYLFDYAVNNPASLQRGIAPKPQ